MERRPLAGMSFECNADETIRITFASVCPATFLLESFRPFARPFDFLNRLC